MRFVAILLLLFCGSSSRSQSFKAEATIPPVQQDGFYRILISPKLNVYLNDDFSDVRLFDFGNKEINYLLQRESSKYYTSLFHEYEILEKKSKPGCCTSLLLRNPNRAPINNINLVIKNAEATREASLLGSDDKMQWFALKDHIVLSATNNSEGTFEAKIVDFPWSNYEYYSLRVKDSSYAPLNILKAGYHEVNPKDGEFNEVRPVKIEKADSASEKKTYVRFLFRAPQFVDKLEVFVNGAKYYRRKATLAEKRVVTSKGKRVEYYRPLQVFELTTGRSAVVELHQVRAQDFLITIENEDNPPLGISEVKAYQLSRYITAWLKKDEQYKLKLGQRNLASPVYDLTFFKDSIPQTIPTLETGEVKIIEKTIPTSAESFFKSKTLIWAAIVVVMIVMGFMSVKLVRESSQSHQKHK